MRKTKGSIHVEVLNEQTPRSSFRDRAAGGRAATAAMDLCEDDGVGPEASSVLEDRE